MGGGGKEIKAAAAEGCASTLGKSRGAAGQDGNGKPGGSGKPGLGKPGCGGERCPRRAGPVGSALAALLSALAAASCVYLGVRTSDLQARVAAIEGARGGLSAAAPLPPLPGFSLEQLNAMMQEKVERLLAQVCGTGVAAAVRCACGGHGGCSGRRAAEAMRRVARESCAGGGGSGESEPGTPKVGGAGGGAGRGSPGCWSGGMGVAGTPACAAAGALLSSATCRRPCASPPGV